MFFSYSFKFRVVSKNDIFKVLWIMDIFRVIGVDIILVKVIRIVVFYISNIVVNLFNVFFKCSRFSFIWRNGKSDFFV